MPENLLKKNSEKTTLSVLAGLSLTLSLAFCLNTQAPAHAASLAGLHSSIVAEGEGADTPKENTGKKKGYAEDAVKHYNRGVEFHQNGSLNQAIQEYKAAIEADGRLAEAYSNLGAVYLAQRNYAKAAEAFNKALALKPDRPTTLNGLGNALYARGQAAEAKDKWAKAIEIDPTFASAYYNLGNALESEKDDKAAITEYMKAIDANPKMADAFYRIGGILHKSKHAAQANVFLRKSMELSPNADFQRDATKMLKEQETEFTKEVSTKEVEMTVVPPAKESGSSARKTSGDAAVATAEKKTNSEKSPVKTTEKTSEKSTSDDAGSKNRFPLFRRKPKEEKKVEMFVQPPGASQDLKPSPGDGSGEAPKESSESNPPADSDSWK